MVDDTKLAIAFLVFINQRSHNITGGPTKRGVYSINGFLAQAAS